jgi:hypothetical protein
MHFFGVTTWILQVFEVPLVGKYPALLTCFSNVDDIYRLSQSIYKDFKQYTASAGEQTLGAILLNKVDFVHICV